MTCDALDMTVRAKPVKSKTGHGRQYQWSLANYCAKALFDVPCDGQERAFAHAHFMFTPSKKLSCDPWRDGALPRSQAPMFAALGRKRGWSHAAAAHSVGLKMRG